MSRGAQDPAKAIRLLVRKIAELQRSLDAAAAGVTATAAEVEILPNEPA